METFVESKVVPEVAIGSLATLFRFLPFRYVQKAT